jgi:hypothetical protein
MTTATLERPTQLTLPCVHRWRIESPHDGLHEVSGECRNCGASRMFRAASLETEAHDLMRAYQPRPKREPAERPPKREPVCRMCGRRFDSNGSTANHERGCGNHHWACADCGGRKGTLTAVRCRPCADARRRASSQERPPRTAPVRHRASPIRNRTLYPNCVDCGAVKESRRAQQLERCMPCACKASWAKRRAM